MNNYVACVSFLALIFWMMELVPFKFYTEMVVRHSAEFWYYP